jgi:hypothetical protein
VLLLCFSAPLVHLILRRTGLFLHSRCTLLIAHPPQLHPHRPSGFRRRTALCRSYRRCFLFYDHTDGISTRPIRISHGTHCGCCHIATDFPCVSKNLVCLSCTLTGQPVDLCIRTRPSYRPFAVLYRGNLVPISSCCVLYDRGRRLAVAGYASPNLGDH